MKRAGVILALALLAGCGTKPATDGALPADFALNSTTIALPDEPVTLPAGAEAVTLNCTACHSGEMILAQPPLNAEKWQAEIDKMRSVFKASIDPAQDPKLIAELIALQTTAPASR